MKRLADKVAVITGGAGVLGLAVGALFAREGARILLVDVDQAALQDAVDSIGNNVASYEIADTTDPEQVQCFVNTSVQRYDRIDIFVANGCVTISKATFDPSNLESEAGFGGDIGRKNCVDYRRSIRDRAGDRSGFFPQWREGHRRRRGLGWG